MLLLSSDHRATVQDIADALGTTGTTISAARQSIRRKLNVPKGFEVMAFLREQEADLSCLFEPVPPAAEPPEVERRRYHVLRGAIRDLDVAARRASTRAAALRSLAEQHGDADEAAPLLEEARVVEALARDMTQLRDRVISEVRSVAAST